MPCSFRAWWYGRAPGSSSSACSRAWPTPATLPCPKMPKQPSTSRCSTPSRSLYCWARNRTTAWATVRRTVLISGPPRHRERSERGRGASSSLLVLLGKGQTGVDRELVPGAADPRVCWVVADQPAALSPGPGHDVEVVQVVSRRGHRGTVPAVRDEYDVAGADLGEHVDRPVGFAVHAL